MESVEEGCNAAIALLRIDPKMANSDPATVHNIQLTVRRLLTLSSVENGKNELVRRQLTMLAQLLAHFGAGPIRSLRLLIADFVYKSMTSPCQHNRRLAASLHRWYLTLFGAEGAQLRSEFLAVSVGRLACQHLGVDYRAPELAVDPSEAKEDVFYLFHQKTLADTEVRLVEQLALNLSPIELLTSYCQALANLLSSIGDFQSSPTVDLYLPSIVAIFDIFNEALARARSGSSKAELARLESISLPVFELAAAVAKSTFARQLLPIARRITKPVILGPSVINLGTQAVLFLAWAKALRCCVEAFGFRSNLADEPLVKACLELVLKMTRAGLSGANDSKTCFILSNCCEIFSALLRYSLSAQRTPAVETLLTSALQIVTVSFSTASRHLCPRCSKPVCAFLAAGILSPPFSSGGTPATHPTIASVLATLRYNAHNLDVDVAACFSSTLSLCLSATARPLAPPIFSPTCYVEPAKIDQELIEIAESPQIPVKTHPSPTSRRRLRSGSSISSVPSVRAEATNKARKSQSDQSTRKRHSNMNGEEVILVDDDVVSPAKNRRQENQNGSVAITVDDESDIDGLFSSFVPAPPDNLV